jgi:hypothetical protein
MAIAASLPRPQDAIPRALVLTCFALCVANVAWLAAMYAGGHFLIDSLGRAKPADFVNVWAAGQLALEGRAADAYDWTIHKTVENAAVGYDFAGYYGWHYPPPFLFIAAALALFPYLTAFAMWLAVTLPIFLCTVRAIVGHPAGWWVAAGFPAIITNVLVGQNGFITASLIGGTLVLMEKRPVLSGVCLGLLTYKPQFGLLFPFVLIAARQWTVFRTAAIVGAALALASWIAFGTESWRAFFDWLPVTSQAVLSEGRADLTRLQSVFAAARGWGASELLAWTLQIAAALVSLAALCILWRSRAPFALKAAALAAASLLATPYVYLYDTVVLTIAAAFLVRHGIETGFRSHEPAALAAAAVLMSSFPFIDGPVALGATLIVLLLILLRAQPRFGRATR